MIPWVWTFRDGQTTRRNVSQHITRNRISHSIGRKLFHLSCWLLRR